MLLFTYSTSNKVFITPTEHVIIGENCWFSHHCVKLNTFSYEYIFCNNFYKSGNVVYTFDLFHDLNLQNVVSSFLRNNSRIRKYFNNPLPVIERRNIKNTYFKADTIFSEYHNENDKPLIRSFLILNFFQQKKKFPILSLHRYVK